jgi:hypothetical protein
VNTPTAQQLAILAGQTKLKVVRSLHKLPPTEAGPGVCVSWGLQDGSGFDAAPSDPAAFVAHCKAHGIDYIALQVIEENRDAAARLKEACVAQGVHCGGWTNVAQQAIGEDNLQSMLQRIKDFKSGFFQANIEERWELGDGSWNGCHARFTSEFRRWFPLKPAVLNTNAGGFNGQAGGYDRDAAKLYWSRHFGVQSEDYWVNSENLTPSGGDFWKHEGWENTGLGFPHPSSSMAGIFGSETGRTNPDGSRLWNTVLGEQPRLKASGRSRGQWYWTCEYFSDDDWRHAADTF